MHLKNRYKIKKDSNIVNNKIITRAISRAIPFPNPGIISYDILFNNCSQRSVRKNS